MATIILRASNLCAVERWFIAALLAAPLCSGGVAAGEGVADADLDGSCEAGASCSAAEQATKLRWRCKPYDPQHGVYTYGGRFVEEVFAHRGFQGPKEDDDWDVLWTHYDMSQALKAVALPPRPGRLVNHCQYFTAAGHKCRLARHVSKVQRALQKADAGLALGPNARSRHLRTFELKIRAQAEAWRKETRVDPDRIWLVKECTAGHSKGIRLLRGSNTSAVDEVLDTWSVAQEYVARPFLLDGRKFHMRLYLLVTRWAPIGAFLYGDGVIFRSKRLYDRDQPSVQRDVFSGISEAVEPSDLAVLWNKLGAARGRRVLAHIVELFAEILGNALEESYGSAGDLDARGYSCFDLFGADVMLDEDLQPLLLEVNQGPNMWVDGGGPQHEPFQRSVKGPLLEQLLKWAELRVRRPPQTLKDAAALEDEALQSFQRIL